MTTGHLPGLTTESVAICFFISPEGRVVTQTTYPADKNPVNGEFTLAIRHHQPRERAREEGYRLLPFVKRR
jgi:hypothetical protein